MRTVLKYEINLVEKTVVKIPEGAKFLCARLIENYYCCVYMLIDWKRPMENRQFMVATVGGKNIPDADELKYLASFFPENDLNSYHIFELISRS